MPQSRAECTMRFGKREGQPFEAADDADNADALLDPCHPRLLTRTLGIANLYAAEYYGMPQ